MKSKVAFFLMIVLAFLLQCTVLPRFSIGSIKPNLLVVVCVAMGLIQGRKSGLWTGFFCGLFIDLFYSTVPGLYALAYMYVGYLCGYAHMEFYDDDLKVPLLMTLISDFTLNLVFYLFAFLLRGRQNLLLYLRRIILPEVFYTVALTLVLYRPLRAFIIKFRQETWKESDSTWVIK